MWPEKEIFSRARDAKPAVLACATTSWRSLMKRPNGWASRAETEQVRAEPNTTLPGAQSSFEQSA